MLPNLEKLFVYIIAPILYVASVLLSSPLVWCALCVVVLAMWCL
jgi:hypothetical protein